MECYRNVRLTEEIVPEEIVEVETDLEADLLSGGVGLDAIKGKKMGLI
jgi:hypothetical protein